MILITVLSRDNFVWPGQYVATQEAMDSLSPKLQELFSEAEKSLEEEDDDIKVFIEDEYKDEDTLMEEIDAKLCTLSLPSALVKEKSLTITKAYIILST